MTAPVAPSRRRYRPAVRLAPTAVLLAVALTSCGSEGPGDYSDETRSNVLAACVGDTDRPIVGDVCTCAYRAIRTTLPYERFDEIDRHLRERSDAPLPDEVLELIADCIVEVGEL